MTYYDASRTYERALYSTLAPASAYALHQFSYRETQMDRELNISRPQLLNLTKVDAKYEMSQFCRNPAILDEE